MKRFYILGLILGATLLTTRGDIIPTLSTITPSGGGFSWNYTANVTGDEAVKTGDYFTIYDFGNFIGTPTATSAGWTFVTPAQLLTAPPPKTNPFDNPTLLNLTWRYDGSTTINGAAALGTFSVVANVNQMRTADFAALATRINDPTDTKISNVGTISVPVPEMSALLPILSICGAGLLSLLPSLLRRRTAA